MNKTARALLLCISLLGSFAVGLGSAAACSCTQSPQGPNGEEQIQSWRLERASDVVRGKIIGVRAGDDAIRGNRRVMIATMKIQSTVKGSIPPGNLTIVTNLDSAMCGMPEFLLMGLVRDREVVVELTKPSEAAVYSVRPDEYVFSMCHYREMSAWANGVTPRGRR